MRKHEWMEQVLDGESPAGSSVHAAKHTCFIDSGGDAPDTRPTAEATKEAAEISAKLGREQLAESRRQYEKNMQTVQPVLDAQLGLMRSQQTQGDDYYKYNVDTYRPLEKGMVAQAEREGSDARLEEVAAEAAADARAGSTQQMNALVRQGLRYGYSPEKLAAMAAEQAGANASSVASAMTNARNNQRNVGWARKMDAAGLGRNLTGASQGAYGLSINAGNSAVNNTMQPGNQLLTGMNQGANIINQGQQTRVQGLTSAMNAQAQSGGGSGMAGLGSLLGGAAAIAPLFMSDRRLKKNIKRVGVDEKTGLNLYEFEYKDAPRYRGVMADEVEEVMPEAVVRDKNGLAAVNYDALGIEMVEV